MDKELYIFFSTPNSCIDGSLIKRSIDKLIECGLLKKENWSCVTNNTESLAKRYNDILFDDAVTGKILILCHNDVSIDDIFIKDKLNRRFDSDPKVGVVGVAGSRKIRESGGKPNLWHLITPIGQHCGQICTVKDKDLLFPWITTTFGPGGQRALLIDGCFMAIDVDRVRMANDVMFDESCPSKFHFYDLIFSLRCYWAGIKVYVDPIHILHMSPGLKTITDDFLNGNKYFSDMYIDKIVGKM